MEEGATDLGTGVAVLLVAAAARAAEKEASAAPPAEKEAKGALVGRAMEAVASWATVAAELATAAAVVWMAEAAATATGLHTAASTVRTHRT